MPRGGRRVGAGRPSKGLPITKATIYLSDREVLNNYAESFGMPVNEFIHQVLNNQHFNKIIEDLKQAI